MLQSRLDQPTKKKSPEIKNTDFHKVLKATEMHCKILDLLYY